MYEGPCRNCGSIDRYVKGKFSYCRPCHAEASRRSAQRKKLGEAVEVLRPPEKSLAELLKQSGNKARCPKGHSMTGDNVAISAQRGGRHLRRRCRACERNEKRVSYGLAPEPEPTKLTDLLND